MGRDSYSNRWTVENCKSISTKFLKENGYFKGLHTFGGVISWSCRGQSRGSVGISSSMVEGDEYIRFEYTYTDRTTEEKTNLNYKVRLVSTPCHFGGKRWWFICPLVIEGHPCQRRITTLYLPNAKYFGCRHCYNLTYESCKESHKYDRLFRDIAKMTGLSSDQVKQTFKEDFLS